MGCSKARLVTKSATVKPIPARTPVPHIWPQVTPRGMDASPDRTAAKAKRVIPTGLPMSRPRATASPTCMAVPSPRVDASRWTPALARANSGMIRKATHRSSRSFARISWARSMTGRGSTRGRAGVRKPRATPATVACTPDFSIASHTRDPSTT